MAIKLAEPYRGPLSPFWQWMLSPPMRKPGESLFNQVLDEEEPVAMSLVELVGMYPNRVKVGEYARALGISTPKQESMTTEPSTGASPAPMLTDDELQTVHR